MMADNRPPSVSGTGAEHGDPAQRVYELQGKSTRRRAKWTPWAGVTIGLALAVVAVLYFVGMPSAPRWLDGFLPQPSPVEAIGRVELASVDMGLSTPSESASEEAAETAAPSPTTKPTETEPAVTTAGLVAQKAPPTRQAIALLPSPTPEPGGEILQISPRGGDVGWWVSGDNPQAFIGDSFLYSGFGDQETFVAAIRFDLTRVDRGAEVLDGRLQLTGLRDDLLNREGNTSWLVQLIAEEDLPALGGTDFSEVFGAPASITLSPELTVLDVAAGRVNEWVLDENSREWLFQQIVDGSTSVIVRILPFNVEDDSLFAWDSGNASESEGRAPTLALNMGPPPPIPPPTPTRPVVVATLTPLPENVLTVVAQAAAATEEAVARGTGTPSSVAVVTPTPVPENLATVQAAAIFNGLPPVVLNTPAPANAATATANSAFATAVALTTGTFTPVPTNYVTPVIYYPPPPPENVATAAARVLYATAVAGRAEPTSTRPWNAVAAVYVLATETPGNEQTAIARIVERNQNAIAEGTPTPTPWNLVVITSVPEPTVTPIPLVVAAENITATPTPTPMREIGPDTLDEFKGKILFLSDRGGSAQTWVMDPASGDVLALVTDDRVHPLARERFLATSADGNRRAYVDLDGDRNLQIFVEDNQYGRRQQVTNLVDCCGDETTTYDPTWSPTAEKIAFVSTASGGDEIYVLDLAKQDPDRLTVNSWEWDKHPTWSPDGSQIAFFSNRESGRTQIWIMDADGSNPRNLSNNVYNDWDPVWVR